MKRKLFVGILLVALTIPFTAMALEQYQQVVFQIGANYYYDMANPNEKITMDVAPTIYNSRTYLPVRFVANSMGIVDPQNIEWDPYNQVVAIANNDTGQAIVMKIGSKDLIYFEGNSFWVYQMDVAPMIVNSRTMLPVRYVAEPFDYEVLWDGNTQKVTLKKIDL